MGFYISGHPLDEYAGALAKMRVLMVSSRQRESDLRHAFDLGADDVIKKPFPPVLLLQRLGRLMSR